MTALSADSLSTYSPCYCEEGDGHYPKHADHAKRQNRRDEAFKVPVRATTEKFRDLE
jgi:hypothetical protein